MISVHISSQKMMMHTSRNLCFAIVASFAFAAAAVECPAQDSPAAAMMRLLKSGRVPEDRIPTLLELVGSRGNAADLDFIYQQCVSPEGYRGAVRLKALDVLAAAAENRNVQPDENLEQLRKLILPEMDSPVDAKTRLAAIYLAGVWKVDALSDSLSELASGDDPRLQQASVNALVAIGSQASRQALVKMTAASQPLPVRYRGTAALAMLDPRGAGPLAAELLSQEPKDVDPASLIDAFLNHQGGSNTLAAALADRKLSPETAKLALRHMYAVGRSDGQLAKILGDAAGIGEEPPPPTEEEIKQIVAEVLATGDPARGEAIFRRDDLSCMKCHAVSKAGGDVGPDLSPVGSSSPPDYLVKSILLPDEAVKEAYLTHIVVTDEGKIYQGIITDRNNERILLKEANGEQRSIPVASIDDMVEGRSLMPKGLTRFLTRAELVDLVRFLSELGKPGPYAIRTRATVQRWRVLAPHDDSLTAGVPNSETFSEQVLALDASAWHPAYAKVAGWLPLEEIVRRFKSKVLYLRGDLNVTMSGKVAVRIEFDAPYTVWVDDEPFAGDSEFSVELERGLHAITLRVDVGEDEAPELRVTFSKPPGSTAEFTVVDGR